MSYTANTPDSKRREEKLIVMDIFGSNEGGGGCAVSALNTY
jgi:hypothetical protein